MHPAFGPALFACSGLRDVESQLRLLLPPLAIVGILTFVAYRRWRQGRGAGYVPILCAALFVAHPAWTDVDRGCNVDIRKDLTAAGMTWLSWMLVFVPTLTGSVSRWRPALPAAWPPRTSPPSDRAGDANYARVEFLYRLLDAIVLRVFAATAVGLFAYAQYLLIMPPPRFAGPSTGRTILLFNFPVCHEPGHEWGKWALGPLYFLWNASPADDWIGYALLAVAVPCLLSVVVWPNRWTALVASLTGWTWLIPATVRALCTE